MTMRCPIDSKVKEKRARQNSIIRDYLKPKCEEELSEEDYPKN